MSDIKKSHYGRFHKYLGIPEGKTIPMRRILTALKTGSKHVKEMAQYAKNVRG